MIVPITSIFSSVAYVSPQKNNSVSQPKEKDAPNSALYPDLYGYMRFCTKKLWVPIVSPNFVQTNFKKTIDLTLVT
jgi:hypothetical protein